MNRLYNTESAVFLYCRFSLFLKDLFFSDYLLSREPVFDQDYYIYTTTTNNNIEVYKLKSTIPNRVPLQQSRRPGFDS